MTAQNDTGTVNEDATLTVDNSDNANSATIASVDDSNSLTIDTTNTQTYIKGGLAFNNDGTRMYTFGHYSGGGNRHIFQYELTTPFDVSTATTSSDDYGSAPNITISDGDKFKQILFNDDGTNFFLFTSSFTQNDGGHHIDQYQVSTAWDVTSTITKLGTFRFAYYDPNGIDFYPRALAFNNDGTKLFASGSVSYTHLTLPTNREV